MHWNQTDPSKHQKKKSIIIFMEKFGIISSNNGRILMEEAN